MDENTALFVPCRRVNTYTYIYRVFQEGSTIIREDVPYVKLHKYNKTYTLHNRSWMLNVAMAREV